MIVAVGGGQASARTDEDRVSAVDGLAQGGGSAHGVSSVVDGSEPKKDAVQGLVVVTEDVDNDAQLGRARAARVKEIGDG